MSHGLHRWGLLFSKLLDTRLVEFGEGTATLELEVREELCQQYGGIHGGVLAYLADNALTLAAGSTAGSPVITAGFTINFLRPAGGRVLRAQAQVGDAGRTLVVCRCDVTSTDDAGAVVLCAVAQGTVAILTGQRQLGLLDSRAASRRHDVALSPLAVPCSRHGPATGRVI